MQKLLAALLMLSGLAAAQTATITRVTDTSGNIINPGDNTNRAVRVNVVAGGAGGGDVNITGYNGTAPGAGNPLHVTCVAGCTPGGSFSDNTAFTFGTTAISIAGYVLDDVSPNAATENSAAAPRMSSNRVPYAQLRDASGAERGANVTAGNALVVDGSASIQPISASSLPLPTGAATAAKQPALGTAGSASTDVLSVQGIASMTALKVDGSAVTQPVSGTVTANAGTNLNTSALALESGGNLATVAGAVRAEDAASADAHTGIGALAVRKATPANTSGTDGDYEFLQMSAGRLWTSSTIDSALPAGANNIGDVDVLTVPSDPFGANADAASATGSISAKLRFIAGTGIPVTSLPNVTLNAETTKVIGTVRSLGNAGAVFDGVNTAATAPANGILGLGIYNSTEPSPTTGQSVGIQLDSKGRQRQVLMDAAGNTRGANVNASNQLSVSVDNSNVSTNVAEMNGVAVTMNNGTAGTGVQRVAIASDNSAIANFGHGATGSAVPANATYFGAVGSGNLKGVIACDNTERLEMTTATTTQILAASGSTTIYICALSVQVGGASTVTMKYGTGTNCGTGTTSLSPAWEFLANSGIVEGAGLGMIYKTTASQALCFTNSAGVNAHIHVTYTQF